MNEINADDLNTNSVNENQELAGVSTASPRPAPEQICGQHVAQSADKSCVREKGHSGQHRSSGYDASKYARKRKSKPSHEQFREFVREESRKGNVVFMGFEGPMVAPLDEFIKQPADGILYDLNRLPEVVMTFIDDPKWVNDYAVQMVIRRLRELNEPARDAKTVQD